MVENIFDVVVIGGGPGGYVGAIRGAQLGLKVACIEKRKRLGGTCLNVGCIPSKALLNSSHKYEEVSHLKNHGINVGSVKLDFAQMMKNKDSVVDGLGMGIDGLFKKNKITRFIGSGYIEKDGSITITDEAGKKENIKANNIVIATGSEVMPVPNMQIDEERIVSSTGALSLKEVPAKMIVVGGGYIGLEMGSVYRRLGSEVTVVEYMDRLVPAMDIELSKTFQKILEKQGMKFMLGNKVLGAKVKGKTVELEIEPAAGGKKETLKADVVLASIGRKPHTENLGLENVGVELDDRGRIVVDEHLRTSVKHIYAIGDVIAGPMLAHKAEEEGVAAMENIVGKAGHVNYNTIPGVVYTHPEVATVGKTEEELKKEGKEYKVGKFPFMANSRARAIGDADGFVKILACPKTDTILGAHIIGPEAGTLISELVLAMEYKAASEDIAVTCHAHPTLNEAVKEACLSVLGRAIHF